MAVFSTTGSCCSVRSGGSGGSAMMNLLELGLVLTGVKAELEHSGHKILEQSCVLLEDSAKGAIGTYEFNWPPLKPETIARKMTGDSPLLETGALRDSITHNVDPSGKEAAVGTDLDYAKYLEFGTSKMPARPFLGGALIANEHKIGETVVAEVKKIFEK
jgi:HK97 gp10 family phage protein